MSAESGIALVRPPLSGLRSAIEWLSTRGVPTPKLASLFGTNTNHIRQLVYRARRTPFRLYAPAGSLKTLLDQPAENLRGGLGVRPGEDDVVLSPNREVRIRQIENEVDRITTENRDFDQGIRKLRRLLPYIGYPGQVSWLRLSAKIHRQTAWFLCHSGHCASAFEEAKLAINLSRVAYAEWNDAADLRQLSETCLIAANSCLLVGDAIAARQYLEIAKAASDRTNDPCGSEHYRQLGVAHFQIGEDQLARSCFSKAPEAMDAKREAENGAHLLMTGLRHLALLGRGNWDDSLEVLSAVRRDYPDDSLQVVMMINSAAAAGLLTGSPQLEISALELLGSNAHLANPYHQQLTRTALLSLTPELPGDIRRAWIRRALYENAFKEE